MAHVVLDEMIGTRNTLRPSSSSALSSTIAEQRQEDIEAAFNSPADVSS